MFKLPENIDSKFRFIQIAARRAEQLMKGADPRVEAKTNKSVLVAVDEVMAGKVDFATDNLREFEEAQRVKREEWEAAHRPPSELPRIVIPGEDGPGEPAE